MNSRHFIYVLLLALGLGAFVYAANPLANLPSAPGSTVAQIAAMGDNTWLNLGSPAADPVWGKCRGRSWGSRQTYATDLGGGFFCGEGPHAYVKPDGHMLDDLWFYDANQHQWICVYPGTPCATLNLHLDSNGFEVNENGDFIPVSYVPHVYGHATYIPGLKRYFLDSWWDNFWISCCPQRNDWLSGAIKGDYQHPFWWDADSNKWIRPFSSGPGPVYNEGSLVQYIPPLNKVFFINVWRDVFLYDPVNYSWEMVHHDPTVWANQNGCYDSKRNRMYAANTYNGAFGLAYYDFSVNNWTIVNSGGLSFSSTNSAGVNYDSTNDVIVRFDLSAIVNVYDIDTDRWAAMPNTYPAGINMSSCIMSFYDSKLNVHFMYRAGDGSDNGVMLAYRYKKATGTSGERARYTVEQKARVSVFPNPAVSRVSITVAGGHDAQVRIFDVRGRQVNMRYARKGEAVIDVTGLKTGVYLVKAEAGERVFYSKFLVR